MPNSPFARLSLWRYGEKAYFPDGVDTEDFIKALCRPGTRCLTRSQVEWLQAVGARVDIKQPFCSLKQMRDFKPRNKLPKTPQT